MTVCYVFIWTEPLHLVTGYHQPIHSLAKIKSSNYSLTNQGCFGFFFFQKVLNSINSSLTRNGKGLISRIIVLLLQFVVFKFSCWLDWKFYDIAYENSLIQLWSCGVVLSCHGYLVYFIRQKIWPFSLKWRNLKNKFQYTFPHTHWFYNNSKLLIPEHCFKVNNCVHTYTYCLAWVFNLHLFWLQSNNKLRDIIIIWSLFKKMGIIQNRDIF